MESLISVFSDDALTATTVFKGAGLNKVGQVILAPRHPGCRRNMAGPGRTICKSRIIILGGIIFPVVLGYELTPELRSPNIIVIVIHTNTNGPVPK